MYEQFYGLKNAPFRLSPDPAFFFGSQGHSRALAYLRYGLTQKEGFIVITGAPGTGKTTLARSLLKEISREKIVVAELSTTHLEADDVLRMVAAAFNLGHENLPKATLLKRIESFCISRYRAGYHVLLLVDEAQNLPYDSLEELRMLSNFYLGKDALIQIFLLGQEQFRNTLYTTEMEQLRQRVVASSHLEPLNNTETREYIEHRLTLSGWTNNPKITDRAFVRIYSLTRGVPRRINTFCERLMLYGSLEGLTEFHDDAIKIVAKELMYEVSAKGVKLSDIKPGVPNAGADLAVAEEDNEGAESAGSKPLNAQPVASENDAGEKGLLDSDALNAFSDEVEKDTPAVDVLGNIESEVTESKSTESKNIQADSLAIEAALISSAEPTGGDSVFKDSTNIDDEDSGFAAREAQMDGDGNIGYRAAEASGDVSSKYDAETKSKKKKTRTEKPKQNQPLRIVARGNVATESFEVPQTETPLVDTKPVWWDFVALAVAFHAQPEKFKSITSSKTPTPAGVNDCFKIAIGKMRVPEYLRTGELSGLTDQDIREALRYYIKNVLLSNTADYYRRLGVVSSASFEEIRAHYKYLFRLFQPDKEQNASNWDETFTRRINQAYGTLRSTEKRKEYDEFLIVLKSRNSKKNADNEKKNALLVAQASAAAAQSDGGSVGEHQKKILPIGLIVGSVIGVAVAVALFVFQNELKAVVVGASTDAATSLHEPAQLVDPALNRAELVIEELLVKANVQPEAQLEVLLEVSREVVNAAPFIELKTETAEKIKANVPEAQSPEPKTPEPESLKPKISEVEQMLSAQAAPLITEKLIAQPAVIKPEAKLEVIKRAAVIKKSVVEKIVAEKTITKPVVPKLIQQDFSNQVGPAVIPAVAVVMSGAALIKPAQAKATNITEKRLTDFITRFSLSYEEGNLDEFMVFFSPSAATNDALDKTAIRADYKALFAGTEMRVIDLDNLNWKIEKQKAVGKGEFAITVLGAGAGQMKAFTGLVKLEIVEINRELKLEGMFHAYGEK